MDRGIVKAPDRYGRGPGVKDCKEVPEYNGGDTVEGRKDIMNQLDIETSFGRVRVYRKGIGEKRLLLLHGAGCDHAMLTWRETMERLYYDDYTAYAVDLPGYGASDHPADMVGEEFYQKHVLVLREVCDELKLNDFTLAGLSMGAAIAVRFALGSPDRVSRLVLIDPWGVTKRMRCHRFCYRYLKKERHMRVWYARMAKYKILVKWMIGYSLIGDKRKITPELVDEEWDACRQKDAYKSMYDYQISSLTKKACVPFYERDWKRLAMPVVFIQGDRDRLVPAADVKRAAEAVSQGSYHELKGSKHWSVREQPEEFIRILEGAQSTADKTEDFH